MGVLFGFDFKKGNKNNLGGNSTKIIPFIITFADDLLLFGVCLAKQCFYTKCCLRPLLNVSLRKY